MIRRGEIIIEYGGDLQYLSIGPPVDFGSPAVAAAPSRQTTAPVVDQDGSSRTVSRSNLLATVGGRTDEILGHTRFAPYIVNGEVKGIQINGIAGESVIKEMGVLDGDVITRANGYAIDSYQAALQVWERLKYSDDITIELLRDGERKTLHYSLTN